jgi:hypothetical protein
MKPAGGFPNEAPEDRIALCLLRDKRTGLASIGRTRADLVSLDLDGTICTSPTA